jgi:hypothetical protein
MTAPADCSDLGTDGRAVCDEGYMCVKHYREEDAYWRAVWDVTPRAERDPDAYREQMRDAGRAHLLPPED